MHGAEDLRRLVLLVGLVGGGECAGEAVPDILAEDLEPEALELAVVAAPICVRMSMT